MTITEELTELANRVDANLEENIDLADVAGAIRALAEKCAGKVVLAPVCGRYPSGTLFVWVRGRVETAPTHPLALAQLQTLLDAKSATPDKPEGG